MNKVWIIFRKEVVDNLRDYRSWFTGLFWALFGPILMGVMMIVIGSSLREKIEQPLHLPVQGQENAPNLIRFLEQHDVIVERAPSDPEAAVKQGDLNVILVIPAEYGEDFSSGKTAIVRLILDNTRPSAQVDIVRIRNLLDAYSTYLGTLRLVVRGVSPEIIQAVTVEEVNVATPQSQATLLISFMPYFIIFAVFSGAAPIVTDTTAGERERQSLEPLLINPVPRRNFVWGKLLAAFPFSLASLAITLIGFGVVFNVLPVEEFLGNRIGLTGVTLLLILVICLPIVFLACSIQMLVASFTRSTKEAGTYLPFIALVPSLPGIALAFFPVKPDLWTMLIPTFGQQILINQFMRFEPISVWNTIVSTVMTIAISVAITFIAIKLYEGERIVMRRG